MCVFQGHKSVESLKHYNPTATIEQREERAITLQTRTKPAAIPGGSQSKNKFFIFILME